MSSDEKYHLCADCKKQYDHDAKKPLLLPCGHVCCRACASSMEDRDDQVCPCKECKKEWKDNKLTDLKTVFDLIPGNSKGERHVVPAPSASGPSDGTPAAPKVTASGRDVVPLEMECDEDDETASASHQPCESEKLSLVTECPLCCEAYNGNESRPVLLTCGHASCLSCLETLEKGGSVKCPRCRKMWPKGALKNLPVVKSLVGANNWSKVNYDKKVSQSKIWKRSEELADEWRKEEEAKRNTTSEIYININGRTHATRVDLERDTVDDAIKNVRGHANPTCSRYSYGGATLQRNSRLSSCNMRPYGTITETPRLSGGSNI